MKFGKQNLPSLLVLFLLSACATGYRVSDIEKTLNTNDKELDKMESKLGTDVKNKEKILDCFKGTQQEAAASHPQEVVELISKIENQAKKIHDLRGGINQDSQALRRQVKGRKTYMSNEPGFKELQNNISKIQGDTKDLQGQVNEYSKLSNDLIHEAQKRDLVMVNFDDLSKNLDQATARTTSAVKSANSQINTAETKLKSMDVQKKQEKLATLEKMRSLLVQAESEVQSAQKAGKDLSAQYPEKGLVCIGPYHKSYSYIKTLNQNSDRIKKINADLQKLATTF